MPNFTQGFQILFKAYLKSLVNFGIINYSLKFQKYGFLDILNVPKFPIGTKNHETIFIKY
jgi:hypothetical protein